MMNSLVENVGQQGIPILAVTSGNLDSLSQGLLESHSTWIRATGFKAKTGEFCLLPNPIGEIDSVILGIDCSSNINAWGNLSRLLPPKTYSIKQELSVHQANMAALAWALGNYRFTKYRTANDEAANLILPANAGNDLVNRIVEGIFLARDLINRPAQDLGPTRLSSEVNEIAKRYDAQCYTIMGKTLLDKNYPAIHAVGRAAVDPPQLIDLHWGEANAPKITLVGKGVCFDTGGLDLKSSSGMRKMKKDMGGAATMLALAMLIMDANLSVRLRLLIPAVENSVASNSYRPGDVLNTRAGITVEVGNTDAEGRIILCDALTEADSEKPDLLVDCATLTGAARVALGPDLPAFFTDDEELASKLHEHGLIEEDPLWRLPLYRPYTTNLESQIADINNVSEGPFAGAITAALYLKKFVKNTKRWVHIDSYAWNDTSRPGRPKGGDPLGLRALYSYIREEFS